MIWVLVVVQLLQKLLCTGLGFLPSQDTETPVISNTNFDELNDLVLPTMKTFCIQNQILTGTQIEKLGKMMPNITKLNVGLGNDGFQMVCKTWNKLQVLKIHPFQVDEKHLLGMKTRNSYYHFPNITDLRGNYSYSFAY